MRVLIDTTGSPPVHLLQRTERAIERCGWTLVDLDDCGDQQSPVLVVKAGVWWDTPPDDRVLSQCDEPVFGVSRSREWQRALLRCGGDLSRLRWWHSRPKKAPMVWLVPPRFQKGNWSSVEALWQRFLRSGQPMYHVPSLDPLWDERLRMVQAVTSLQIGGAERVALDLAEELNHLETPCLLVSLGRPLRKCYPSPRRFVDVSEAADRLSALEEEALRFGADVIHLHLVKGAAVECLREAGWPVMITLHNTREGWADGIDGLTHDGRQLLVLGCSREVTRQFDTLRTGVPARCVWNGIRPRIHALPQGWREKLGIRADAIVLLSVANARPQKRLHLMRPIVQELRSRGHNAHLIFAGAGTESLADGQYIHSTGLVDEVGDLLSEADVLINTSAHEGLSLAQLEAMAAGCRVVTTHVGGAAEVPGVTTVPAEASAQVFADAIESALRRPAPELPKSFERHAMARRVRWLAHRTGAPWAGGEGLLLVTNNFSVGGAQSSARRLLLELKHRGVRVVAAVVEESETHPTAGLAALRSAGVEVIILPHAAAVDTEDACETLFRALAGRPPECVVFWNLIASYKVVIADALLHTRVVDVSPGEMFYTSLERYFDSPRTGLPYRSMREYGQQLSAVVVKYEAEASEAGSRLGAPVHVVRNGIPLRPRRSKRASSAPFVVGTATRLAAHKRVEDLIEAFRLLHERRRDAELWIAGGVDGSQDSYVKQLQHAAKDLPVRWLGALQDLTEFHAACSVFAMISEPAGCPNASLEAMAAGLAVVATDVGGASEQVISGRTGILVPPRDPSAFALALDHLASDHELLDAMGEAARLHVAQEFSLEKMVHGYLDVFQLGVNEAVRDAFAEIPAAGMIATASGHG